MRRFPVLACAAVLAAVSGPQAALSAGDATGEVRFLGSPRYLLELPPSPSEDDVKVSEAALRTLERLATLLDAEFVKAAVLKDKDLPKADAVKRFETQGAERLVSAPKSPVRWSVRARSKRDDLVALCQPLSMTVNTEGTAFYCNGRDAFLGLVTGGGGPPLKELLDWGTQQHLFHRAELWFNRPAQPKGACILVGMTHFMRWSFERDKSGFPAELGGIEDSYADKLRKRIADGDTKFPTLEQLFAQTPKDFDADPTTLYGASVLFTEFLWESSAESRKHLVRALQTYGRSGRPVAAFPLQTLVDEEKPVFKSPKELEAAFRKFAVEQSPKINARKRGA